jgi:hypothetical protein
MGRFNQIGEVEFSLQSRINFAAAKLLRRREIKTLSEDELDLADLLEKARWLTERSALCLGSVSVPSPISEIQVNYPSPCFKEESV